MTLLRLYPLLYAVGFNHGDRGQSKDSPKTMRKQAVASEDGPNSHLIPKNGARAQSASSPVTNRFAERCLRTVEFIDDRGGARDLGRICQWATCPRSRTVPRESNR